MSELIANLKGLFILSSLHPMIVHVKRQAASRLDSSASRSWVILKRNRALGDREVLWLGRNDQKTMAICHIPRSKPALLHYQHHEEVCDRLWNNTALGKWRDVLPRELYRGFYKSRFYALETPLAGISASRFIQNDEWRKNVLNASIDAILHLHQQTSRVVIFDRRLFDKWVVQPLQAIRQSTLPLYYPHSLTTLSKIEKHLSGQLLGIPFTLCWIHGDYWTENILVTPDGAQVTGIVDWELSQPDGFPLLDLVNLLLSVNRILEAKELGHLLIDVLEFGAWPSGWDAILGQVYQKLGNNFPDMQDILLLFWLQHTSAKILTTSHWLVNPLWARANYVDVVKYLETRFGS